MLAVAVEHENPVAIQFACAPPARAKRRAFTRIIFETDDFRAGGFCLFSRRIGRAVVNHNDNWKKLFYTGDKRADVRGFVETGNHRRAPTWPVCLQIKNSKRFNPRCPDAGQF